MGSGVLQMRSCFESKDSRAHVVNDDVRSAEI